MTRTLSSWTTPLVLIAAALVLYFASVRGGIGGSAAATSSDAVNGAARDAGSRPPPSNEIGEFQQLG